MNKINPQFSEQCPKTCNIFFWEFFEENLGIISKQLKNGKNDVSSKITLKNCLL